MPRTVSYTRRAVHHPLGPLRHADAGTVGRRFAVCGVRTPVSQVEHFNPAHPRACPSCASIVRAEATS
jgi:hypothetical protein